MSQPPTCPSSNLVMQIIFRKPMGSYSALGGSYFWTLGFGHSTSSPSPMQSMFISSVSLYPPCSWWSGLSWWLFSTAPPSSYNIGFISSSGSSYIVPYHSYFCPDLFVRSPKIGLILILKLFMIVFEAILYLGGFMFFSCMFQCSLAGLEG